MRILVTGGGGFLGSYVVRALLNEGHEVVSFQRRPNSELQRDGAEVIQGDLLDPVALKGAMEGCRAVMHIAAMAGVWGSRESYFSVNVGGTESVLRCMEEQGIEKLVYCSSPSVVFSGKEFKGADESLPHGSNWTFAYPESKAVAEQLVMEWGQSGKGKVIALRPHLIWGVGDPHLFPSIIQRAQASRLRIIGNGRNRVDHTRVENAAAAHVLALKAFERPSAVNRSYFISQGDTCSLWDWVNSLLGRLDISPVTRKIPYGLAYCAGLGCELLWRLGGKSGVPPMTRFVAQAMAKSHWFSIEAARKELGYQPERFPTEEGLDVYAQAWREEQTPLNGP
jgi:nucleoside-diphosphate-sugar epimerase